MNLGHMTTPPLSRHGELTRPTYRGVDDFESTDDARPDGQRTGIFKRYHKKESTAQVATAFGFIKNVYPDAIEYFGIQPGMRGLILLSGMLALAFIIFFGSLTVDSFLRISTLGVLDWLNVLLLATLIAGTLYFVWWSIRMELFRPTDEPVIFDRRNRKVYRLYREVNGGRSGILRFWPLRAIEYDWDLLDADIL